MKGIRQQDESSSMLHIVISNPTQPLRIVFRRATVLKANRLIDAQTSRAIDGSPGARNQFDVASATHHEERAGLSPTMKTSKVVVATIHDVIRPRLRHQVVQRGRI